MSALSLKEIHAQKQAEKSVNKTSRKSTRSKLTDTEPQTTTDLPNKLSVIKPPVKSMTTHTATVTAIESAKSFVNTANVDAYTDIDGVVDSDKMLEDLLQLKYGEVPLCLTTEDIYRLANSKTLPIASVVMLYILMHYGKEYVMNGGTIFEEDGAIAKLALRYGMEPDVVGRTVSKLITANTKWETLSMPTQMIIPFEFDEKGKGK